MRRLWLPLVLSALFVSGPATTAQAFNWQWFDDLSGPKGLKGLVFDWRVACWKEKQVRTVTATTAATATTQPATESTETKETKETTEKTTETTEKRTGFVGSACTFQPGELRHSALDLNFGFLSTTNDEFAGGKKIKLTTLQPSFSWHIWGPVDAGFAGGIAWFSSESFESFTRFTFEPVRVDIRPLLFTEDMRKEHKDWWREFLAVRLGWVAFPHGFEKDDFQPGPKSRITSDLVFNYGIVIDAEPLVRKLRSQW